MSENLELRWAMLDLLNTLSRSVLTLEVMADDIALSATEIADDIGSKMLREVARRQRVGVLELQGQLAALNTRYTALYHSEP